MKLKLPILLFVILFCTSDYSLSQTPVYLTFITHNEDAEPYNNNYNYYIVRRNVIVQLANAVVSRGAKWNFQSDWRFLIGVKNWDTGSVILNTNGKNIIKWLVEDKGIDCDPHAHENAYNYADIAYLHEQLGITSSGVVGGFLYNQIINGNNWENLETGIYGRVYTSYFWRPDILWGGGTPNHINDPQNYGAWKPQSMANYYFHDTTKHLTLIGNGCANKIYDTSLVTTPVQRIRNTINAIEFGAVPDTGLYTATVFMSIGQLNTSQLNKMTQFIDSMGVFVSQGKVVWKNLDEIYDVWNTSYNKKPFWIGCAQFPTIYSYFNIKLIPEGLYDQPNNKMNLKDNVTAYLRNVNSPFAIVDSAEAEIDSLTFNGHFVFFRANTGTYYIHLKHRNSIETWSKNGGISFTSGSTMNYDFTTAASQAYGNNQILKGTKHCIYSGDTNQDGFVDVTDVLMIFNDASIFTNGYVVSDLNGDYIVDVSDLLIAYGNSNNFISKITP